MDSGDPRAIVLFFEHNRLCAAVCLHDDGADTIQILRDTGTQAMLKKSRVVHRCTPSLPARLDDQELTAALQHHIHRQHTLAETVDLAALWGTLPGDDRIDATDLARHAFGPEASCIQEAALLEAIAVDRSWFTLSGDAVLPRRTGDVKRRQASAKERRLHERELHRCDAWLQQALTATRPLTPPSRTCVALLRQYAVHGQRAPHVRDVRALLGPRGIDSPEACFALLVRLGVCSPDENIQAERHDLPQSWPDEVMTQITQSCRNTHRAPAFPEREDLTALRACSIDDPATRDIDDAIHVSFAQGYLELGIHITDVSAHVPPGCPLDRAAARRATSVYFPDSTLPMLPPRLSEDIASLHQGLPRPAISFLITIAADGSLQQSRITLSTIQVSRRMTYAQVDREIARGGPFARMHGFLHSVRARRFAAGATRVLVPEPQVHVDAHGTVSLRIRNRETPAQMLVAECMILANTCAAAHMRDRSCPALYRRQARPRGHVPADSGVGLYEALNQRRIFSRVAVTCSPGSHSGLGVPCYATVTSPLRKYLDLVNQRQLAHLLRGAPPPHRTADLQQIAADTLPLLQRASRARQERTRYWILKLLRRHTGSPLPAVCLDRQGRTCRVVLRDSLLELNVPVRAGIAVQSGTDVTVVLEQVEPLQGTIQARLL